MCLSVGNGFLFVTLNSTFTPMSGFEAAQRGVAPGSAAAAGPAVPARPRGGGHRPHPGGGPRPPPLRPDHRLLPAPVGPRERRRQQRPANGPPPGQASRGRSVSSRKVRSFFPAKNLHVWEFLNRRDSGGKGFTGAEQRHMFFFVLRRQFRQQHSQNNVSFLS